MEVKKTMEPGARDIFVEANGLRHHLIGRGNPGNPVVIMIHGLAGQAHTFDVAAARLAAHCHVYCLDVRGRGESEWGPPNGYHTDNYVADLEAVRSALGIRTFALVGTSMGGIITMNYAPQHPECVTRVVINDIGPEIDPRGLARIGEYVAHAPEAFPDMKAVVRYYRENYAPMVEHLPDDQVESFARWNVRKNDTGVYVWKMDPAIRTFSAQQPPKLDPWDAVRRISCPALILRGANSDVLAPETAQRMVTEMPNARLAVVAGVGHAPVLTEPDAIEALDTFLTAT
jgi:pimeloyl-ACP methyl ester carboxylesterase